MNSIGKHQDSLFMIAEIGVNHEGDINLAKRLIDEAKEGGAHAAKFQAYKAAGIASKHSPAYWDTQKERTLSQFELFKKYDSFGEEEYKELAKHSKAVGIEFMCTAFDLEMLAIIDPLVEKHKIASADLTNIPLLRAVARTGKEVILSTGASNLGEIFAAVEELEANGVGKINLLHCVLNYPTKIENAFLGRIQKLKNLFPDLEIGYSDHTEPGDDCLAVQIAYCLGARIFEKHFTHDKTLPGNDHYHAMDKRDLLQLTDRLSQINNLIGPSSETLFLKQQRMAVEHARRSIVLNSPLKKGELITEQHIIAKRPGHGISPIDWDKVIGMRAVQDLDIDTILKWENIEHS